MICLVILWKLYLIDDYFFYFYFAAQHSFPPGDTSEQEIRFSGVANHYPDQC